jgi:hypothetical protein
MTASGKEDITEAIKDFDKHIDTIHHHFNLFFCQGCLLGPGMVTHSDRFKRRALVSNYALSGLVCSTKTVGEGYGEVVET